jgi:drug/metabolite transporter (DMT)-like permease
VDTQVATRFGNASLQGELGGLNARLSALSGRELGTVSAHQVFSNISVILLIAAGLGILIALVPLARSQPPDFDGAGPWLALFGTIAAACVIYRMVARPGEDTELFALSLREGAWLALLGAVAMTIGGLWPSRVGDQKVSEAEIEGVWSGLSGWTPEV